MTLYGSYYNARIFTVIVVIVLLVGSFSVNLPFDLDFGVLFMKRLDIEANTNDRVAIVTAASSNHGFPLIAFLSDYYSKYSSVLEMFPVIVFDLGMSKGELSIIKLLFPWVLEIKTFDYSLYEDFFDIEVNAGEYAWKPVIIQQVSRRFEKLLWVDSGTRLNCDLFELRSILTADTIVSSITSGDIARWVHPMTQRILDYRGSTKNHMFNGAFIGFNTLNPGAKQLLNDWAKCAKNKSCIAPTGSSRENHRQDQAVLTILLWERGFGRMIQMRDSQVNGFVIFHREVDRDFKYCGGTYDTQNSKYHLFENFTLCGHSALGKEPEYIFSLVNHPDLLEFGRQPPTVVLDFQRNQPWETPIQPEITITMPIYNAGFVLPHSFPSLIKSTNGTWELILVLDGCSDDSLAVVQKYLNRSLFEKNTLQRIIVVEQPTPVWETSSNNLGMRIANPSLAYIVIQSDFIFTEFGWNTILAVPLRLPKVFAISGRCAHSFNGNNLTGRCGEEVSYPIQASDKKRRDAIQIRNTCNRGPLLLRALVTQELGFFDEVHFVLGDDDHDLMRRAADKKWLVGYFPVGFYSPKDFSATRRTELFAPKKVDLAQKEQDEKYFQNRKSRFHPIDYAGIQPVAVSLKIPNV